MAWSRWIRAVVLVAALLAVSGATGCRRKPATLKIGVVAAFSGPFQFPDVKDPGK